MALARLDVSEKGIVSIIKLKTVSKLGTTLAVTSNRRLLVTANVVPNSQILVILMMETLDSSETSVLIRAIRLNFPEDGILQFRSSVPYKIP
jgi:hypothetical protein